MDIYNTAQVIDMITNGENASGDDNDDDFDSYISNESDASDSQIHIEVFNGKAALPTTKKGIEVISLVMRSEPGKTIEPFSKIFAIIATSWSV